ncbi:MAG: tau 95 subunit of transcription factor TFIIIC [Trichoglossum hirsutum]|nr:MAG: tau 95 subunit of transcription factor TFIIIC [Trichoglossum hirsutum]
MEYGSDTGSNQPLGQRISPWYTVPMRSIVCVEHPFIIKDIDKGLKTFGSSKRIEQLVNANGDSRSTELYLRPDDPMCKPLISEGVKTNNILLKVTVPKMVGRKRKRDSSEPSGCVADLAAIQSEASDKTPLKRGEAGYLKRSMQDNVGRYNIEPIGIIDYTHRFRGLSDFQYSTANSEFMKKMRDSVLSYDYEKLKEFKFDPSKGVRQNTDLIPPPYFARTHVPFNYNYRQNPAVRYTIDNAGRPVVVNDQAPPKISTHIVSADVDVIPSGPPSDLPSPATLDHGIQDTISQLTKLMEERPLWTRRALLNHFTNPDYQYTLKHSIQYVGYMFRSGPWRDTIVRFGVDPRSDPKYRFYQSISFQIYDRDDNGIRRQWQDERIKYQRHMKGKTRNLQSHLFDGRHIELDGKVWQVCDITDPLVKGLLRDTKKLRTNCDKWDGWYTNGLWAKVKTIMRAKIRTIREGKIPSDLEFTEILKLPDEFDESSRTQAQLSSNAMHKDFQLGSQIRAMIAQRGGGAYPAAGYDAQHIIGNSQGNDAADETSKDFQGEESGHIEDVRVAEMMLELKRMDREDDAQFDEEEDFDFEEEDDESD